MYFPYLYGKAAELRALRSLANNLGTPQKIWPIVEPTKPAAPLKATLAEFKASGAGMYLAINPHRGELADSTAVTNWRNALNGELADPALIRPTLLIETSTTLAELRTFVAANGGRNIGVVVTGNALPAPDLANALRGTSCIAFLDRHANRSAYAAALPARSTVDIEDNFIPKARNADYSGSDPQGTNHLTWASAAKAGFSDFTILPGTYSDSGGPMGALAIHLTYEHPTELRLQHFVSITQVQGTPLAPKFRESISALEVQIAATPARFRVSPAITDYQAMRASGQYTSAEKNKRLQIIHHLYTVGKILKI